MSITFFFVCAKKVSLTGAGIPASGMGGKADGQDGLPLSSGQQQMAADALHQAGAHGQVHLLVLEGHEQAVFVHGRVPDGAHGQRHVDQTAGRGGRDADGARLGHDVGAMPDEVDEDARAIGAVNTVVNSEGRLLGYNTDVCGFVGALKHHGFSIDGKHVVLMGAGGAARAVVWGLIKNHAAEITMGVRNPRKALALVEYFRKYMDIQLFDWNAPEFSEKLLSADLLVNSTPLGMYPNLAAMPPVAWEQLNPAAFVYDIIYTPAQTSFLQQAAAGGHPTLNGEEMLVGQGAAAFQLWTSKIANQDTMLSALREALRQQDHF